MAAIIYEALRLIELHNSPKKCLRVWLRDYVHKGNVDDSITIYLTMTGYEL